MTCIAKNLMYIVENRMFYHEYILFRTGIARI